MDYSGQTILSHGIVDRPESLQRVIDDDYQDTSDHMGSKICHCDKNQRAKFDQTGTPPIYMFSLTAKPLLCASYQVAYQTAKSKKPHTFGEELIKPCAFVMAKVLLVRKAEKKLQQMSLSNDVILNRITDVSEGILEQVVADIKASPVQLSLQVDQSTYIQKLLSANNSNAVHEGEKNNKSILFCESLNTKAQDEDV
ncbi:protein FAM200C-like [Oratosquilla oratoria]|uniref:protein FAM200C-like n=1 Tax=Oratosquilla oratoria TaxID=337810 RepID=UPI003F75A01D